ncbi:hypothetical protein [Longispora albida]|uniref:hypothetical protein n=1 Tax=Longispora albida TaxID=203523 RepID=UPI000369CBDA|nr:hypothetical protein [Longispora albida]
MLRKVLVTALTVVVTLIAGVQNVRLFAPSPLEQRAEDVVAGALPRLGFLRDALAGGAAEEAQASFPEGYFFLYELYGLAWVNVGMKAPQHKARALSEARWALSHLDSEAGRAPFSAQLKPAYGVFYTGWTSWLRGGIVKLDGGPDAPERVKLAADSAALAEALAASPTPFLEAYPGQAWPVDSVVAVAGLSMVTQLGIADYGAITGRWLAATDERRDKETGLLPHRADAATGKGLDGPRATSQVMLLRFLTEIDQARAVRDWPVFRERFRSTVPGAPGLREYPRGADGDGDVDSGPLILGLSASASAVGLGTAVIFGDREVASELAGLAAVTGFFVHDRYMAGLVPIGDAFMVWSLTSMPWVTGGGKSETRDDGGWRLPWQLGTALIVLPLWFWTWRVWTVRRPRTPSGEVPLDDVSTVDGSEAVVHRS